MNPNSTPSPAALRQQLAQIDNDIVRRRDELRRLEEKRQRIVAELRAVVFPVLTLPPEVTAEIFKQYVQAQDTPMKIHSCYVLVLVCRAWRDVAFGCPALWTELQFPKERRYVNGNYVLVDQGTVETWASAALSRAGQLPLKIDASSRVDVCPHVLGPCTHRIEELAIRLDREDLVALVETFRRDLPILRRLIVSGGDESMQSVRLFDDAPRLQQLSLCLMMLDEFALPWTQLTNIDLQGHDYAELMVILKRTSNVETLRIAILPIGFNSLEGSARLPTLRHLTLEVFEHAEDTEAEYLQLLEQISAPALQALSVQLNSPDAAGHLVSFWERSGCSIVSLTLSGPELSHDDYDRDQAITSFLLQKLPPSLEELRLREIGGYPPLSLVYKLKTDPEFLPRLRVLEMISAPSFASRRSPGEFYEFLVEGQQRRHRRLEEFKFSPQLDPYSRSQMNEERLHSLAQSSDCKIVITSQIIS